MAARVRAWLLLALIGGLLLAASPAAAQPTGLDVTPDPPQVTLPGGAVDGGDTTDPAATNPAVSVQVPDNPNSAITSLIVVTVLSLAPAGVMLITSFTRIVIVLSITRNALGLQQVPPNQVLAGMALLLTVVVMGPTFTEVNDVALEPYREGQIDTGEAIDAATGPFRDFMLDQTRTAELNMMLAAAEETVEDPADASFPVLAVAFLLSELKAALIIGFVIALPFMLLDLVVASTLMSLGMMMLPPVVVSLPIKLLLFVAVDGWVLTVSSLLESFR